MQTWCDLAGEPQLAQLTRETGEAFQWALLCCCFWWDVFFLGTAMISLLNNEWGAEQRDGRGIACPYGLLSLTFSF
jgi:hypothetical protein